MALDGTATGLQASIADWLDDTTKTAVIPDFIKMAEARFNRKLRVSAMEARATASTVAATEYLALPLDCAGVRSIFIEGSPDRPLDMMDRGELQRRFANYGQQKPRAYSISAGQLAFGPVPDAAYTIEIDYYRQLPPLASNSTNWLLTAHPDIYLYACLLAAEMHGWNDARLPMLKAAFDEGLAEIEQDSASLKYGAAPLYPRIARII